VLRSPTHSFTHRRLRKIKGIMINNNEIDLNNDQFEELLRNDIIQVLPSLLLYLRMTD
jgi:hypothetical protein